MVIHSIEADALFLLGNGFRWTNGARRDANLLVVKLELPPPMQLHRVAALDEIVTVARLAAALFARDNLHHTHHDQTRERVGATVDGPRHTVSQYVT